MARMHNEYLVTAADGLTIATVRSLPGDRRAWVPKWIQPAGGTGPPVAVSSVVIDEDEPNAGLMISRATPHVRVWAGADHQLGAAWRVGKPPWLRFSACRCERPWPGQCVCGAPEGELRFRPRFSHIGFPCTVVDAEGAELATITAQPSPALGAAPEPRRGRLRRTWAQQGVVQGTLGAARDLFAPPPLVYALTDRRPGFTWDEWGLTVAIAALCDPYIFGRAFPTQGTA